jgi:predicted DsbA family dithiol-disulfide isomerase
MPQNLIVVASSVVQGIGQAEALSQRHRVDGVPFFIVNDKITLGGAQPPEAFLDAFGRVVGVKW